MAEIFVVNLDSDLDGQYVSDLPVVNSTPVSRQIGFCMGSALTATDSTFNANLVTYLEGITFVDSAVATITASAVTITGNGNLLDYLGTGSSTVLLTAAEDSAGTVTAEQFICRIIQCLAYEGADLTDTATLAASIQTVFLRANGSNPVVLSSGQTMATMSEGEFIAGSANITLAGIMRILAGGEPSDVGAFAEGGILGNQRLIGGMRRIYLRDRVEACIYEGSLSLWKQALNFDGSTKSKLNGASGTPGRSGVQCVIYNSAGAVL